MAAQNYPMAENAINEITSLFNAFGYQVPAELTAVQQRIIDVVDKTINDGSDKDALMTAGILMLAPEQIFSNPYRFEEDYNAKVQELVIEILSLEPGVPVSPDMARIATATTVATIGQIINDLESGRLNGEQKDALKEMLRQGDPNETEFANSMNAPVLRQMYLDTKDALDKALIRDDLKKMGPHKPKGPNKPPRFDGREGGNLDI